MLRLLRHPERPWYVSFVTLRKPSAVVMLKVATFSYRVTGYHVEDVFHLYVTVLALTQV